MWGRGDLANELPLKLKEERFVCARLLRLLVLIRLAAFCLF